MVGLVQVWRIVSAANSTGTAVTLATLGVVGEAEMDF